MHPPAKLLSLATLTAILFPTVGIAAPPNLAATQNPDFFKKTGVLAPITPPHLAQATDRQTEADRLYQEGMDLRQNEEYDTALEAFQAALSVYEEAGDRQGQADTLNQIGNVHLSLNQHDRAAEFYQRALAVRQDAGRSPTGATATTPVSSLASATAFAYRPPDISMPGQRTPGGTRGLALAENEIFALVPDTNYGQTLSPYPTIFVYFAESTALNQMLEMTLFLLDEQGNILYESTCPYPSSPGILGIRFEALEEVPALDVDEQYEWVIEVSDPESRHLQGYISGWVHRAAATSPDLQADDLSPAEKPYLYADEGIWYDAVATFFDLNPSNLENSVVEADLQTLLTSVGLDNIDPINFMGYWSDLTAEATSGEAFLEDGLETPQEREMNSPDEPDSAGGDDDLPPPDARAGGGGGGSSSPYIPPEIVPGGRRTGGGTR